MQLRVPHLHLSGRQPVISIRPVLHYPVCRDIPCPPPLFRRKWSAFAKHDCLNTRILSFLSIWLFVFFLRLSFETETRCHTGSTIPYVHLLLCLRFLTTKACTVPLFGLCAKLFLLVFSPAFRILSFSPCPFFIGRYDSSLRAALDFFHPPTPVHVSQVNFPGLLPSSLFP